MRALALSGVSIEHVEVALRQHIGLGWDDVDHVTATTTLAAAIRELGVDPEKHFPEIV